MFIYREEYYLERTEPSRRADETTEKFHERHMTWEESRTAVDGKAEVIMAKQRHGPTGKIELRFHAMVTKFDNIEDSTDPRDDEGGVPF